VAGANAYCPKMGDAVEGTLRLVGVGMEFTGYLNGNENLRRAGGNVQSGAGIGSAAGELHNGLRDMEGHAKNCFKCEIPKKLNKCEKITKGAKILTSTAEVTSFGVKS